MNIRYHVDPETGLPHIYRHGVGEEKWSMYSSILVRTVQERKVHVWLLVKPRLAGIYG